MGKKLAVTVVEVEGHPYQIGRTRVLGFLIVEEQSFVNANPEFSRLDDDTRNGINTAFTYWIQKLNKPKRHHGWDKSQHGGRHVNCHVFKHVADGTRMYGFKIHPAAEARIEICCVVHYTTKHADDTDGSILDELERLRSDCAVIAAIEKYWSDINAQK